MAKIDIICNDGSPLQVTEKSIYGEDGRMGVGGAELALLTMCRAWQMYGNKVTLYNNPNIPGASTFEQRAIDVFDPSEDRDILIIFRSPNHRAADAKGYKVWWSCDQATVGDFKEFSQSVQKIVTISPRHSKFFNQQYGITNTIHIDLPVRTWEYKEPVTKIPKRCIFTSMPDRGAIQLNEIWPRIHAQVPSASLVITSDWRLWVDWATEDMIRNYKLAFSRLPNVTYRAAVNRKELIQIQMEAAVHLYPCIYDELFCISVAESQVAGAYPITSDCGSLSTTNMGMVIHGDAKDARWQDTFVQNAVEILQDDERLQKKQEWIREVSMKRFSLERVLEQWDSKVFNRG